MEEVITTIYMVRHGESPKTEGNERTRGLTEKGKEDARIVADILQEEGIDTFVSSPYSRAVLTLEGLAKSQGKEIHVFEDLREMVFVPGDRIVANDELYPVVRRMFADAAYSLPGGETIAVCQERAMRVLQQIVHTNRGKKIAIGTHGAIMTLMMSCFDSQYDVDFLFQTSKPDIYRMELNEKDECIGVQRLWRVTAR
ncbi:histidine phosphatase family protein [Paenibacillus sp. MER 180]|uniref:histidine phosphatase family protein n=1 Tax=unclassified Paenibacillus TaxID=185978 RepID=UPI0008066C19|nr:MULTISPECIES: histidine phosphatase family protein [unclassified Paenibacillus]MCM3293022.1 histidine phosphatase family protein [Paenibacillus sp. MER 180]OBY78293.1 phosphoglycerate mutase [Paenibacillus sp. KS1]